MKRFSFYYCYHLGGQYEPYKINGLLRKFGCMMTYKEKPLCIPASKKFNDENKEIRFYTHMGCVLIHAKVVDTYTTQSDLATLQSELETILGQEINFQDDTYN